MTDLIRSAAGFIKANTDAADSLDLAAALDDMMNCRTYINDALSSIYAITGRSCGIIAPVPNDATAFVLVSVRELRIALDEKSRGLACDIADVLRSMPEKDGFHDKKELQSFNTNYIQPFNSKHLCHLPEIV